MKLPAVALGLAISIPLANAYSGALTFYSPGLGSCGTINKNGDAIVALAVSMMANPANPNDNPICNKQISIHNPTTGTDIIATVTDTCVGCAFGDMDTTVEFFNNFAPTSVGRLHNIQWTPIGWTVPGNPSESDGTSSVSSAVQPSSSAAAAALPSAALPSLHVQEKVAAVVPSGAAAPAPTENPSSPAAPSGGPAVSPSVAPSVPSTVVSPSAAQQPSSAPAGPTASCTTAGQTVCSADGTQIGECTMELTVQFGPVALGTKCVGGYLVMANSRLRSRRG